MADVLTDIAGMPAPGPSVGAVAAEAESQAGQYFHLGRAEGTAKMMSGRMPELVKGAGFVGPGGNKPLDNYADISRRGAEATIALRAETWQGFTNKAATVNSLNQGWLNNYGAFKTALLQMSPVDYINQIVKHMPGGGDAISAAYKSFTAGNLGLPGTVSGLTPFNLLSPSRLIYPVYTVN